MCMDRRAFSAFIFQHVFVVVTFVQTYIFKLNLRFAVSLFLEINSP